LIEHLCYLYGEDDEVTSLLNSVDLYIMPSMNPDGFEVTPTEPQQTPPLLLLVFLLLVVALE